MRQSEDDGFTYRSPVQTGPAPLVSTTDERDYSTLLEIQKDLNAAMEGLYKDFNAFTLSGNTLEVEKQIAARQVAYDILAPLQTRVNSVVVELKNKVGRIQ